VAKTATKTAKPSPRSGVALPLGAHPGNTGGKKGRSGRKSRDFLQRCLEATEDDPLWQAAKKKSAFSTLEMAASYTYGKPTKSVEHSGKVKVEVSFDDDGD